MEYASKIWSPPAKSQSIKLELIQRRFLRLLYKEHYGTCPYLFPTRFVMGMIGYTYFELKRSVALIKRLAFMLWRVLFEPAIVPYFIFLRQEPRHNRILPFRKASDLQTLCMVPLTFFRSLFIRRAASSVTGVATNLN
ncbi:uncharacterized protein LOC143913575 [Arctopsyche grandis]|uniref:uncharacterized protein LOC143913575 n=1 Tax=Arctopsyche grandis TaxID=121162 RepID=UPI00406DA3B2